MLIRKPSDLAPSEITSKSVYLRRRAFLGQAVALGLVAPLLPASARSAEARKLSGRKSPFSTGEKLTPYEDVTTYNNFYEFGTGKDDPAHNAQTLQTRPWTVAVDGEVRHKPGEFDIEDMLKPAPLEDRIYRLRCVEAWSMVIPWVGFPLGDLIKRFEPTSQAKYVAFTTLLDPRADAGPAPPVLDWPYVEGLRIDEAMHPLALLAVGLYGQVLPNQNGAPLRLVVPWKYGFKSIKSIVRIRSPSEQPQTSLERGGPERVRLLLQREPARRPSALEPGARAAHRGDFFTPSAQTLMFNGYAEQVAGLYAGMDLRKFF